MIKKLLKDKRFLILVVAVSILALVGAGLIYWRKTTYDPEKYNSYVSAGDDFYQQSEYAKALDQYLLASDVAPREVDAYIGIVTVLGDKSRFDDAKKVVIDVEDKLVGIDNARLYSTLGAQYAQKYMFKEAYESYISAFENDKSTEVADFVALYALKSGEIDAARAYYSKTSNDSEARRVWDKYIEFTDEESDLYELVQLSQELLNGGYPDLVKDLLSSRSDDIKEYWEGKYFLGRAYFDKGEYEDALGEFETASDLGADEYALFWYIARSNMELGDKEEAYKFYKRSVEFASEEDAIPVVEEYANLLIDDGRFVEVENLLLQFVDRNWSKPLLMRAYWQQDKIDQFLEQADTYTPNLEENKGAYLDYQVMMIEYYLSVSDNEKAFDVNELVEEVEGGEALNAYYSGLIEKQKNSNEKAREYFRRSIDLDLLGQVTEKAEKELVNLGD